MKLCTVVVLLYHIQLEDVHVENIWVVVVYIGVFFRASTT